MSNILVPNGWVPRFYQHPLWSYMERGGRRAMAVWHRRAGKDEIALHWTAVSTQRRPATYWHLLPEAAQARKAIWDAVNPHTGKRRIDEVFPLELRSATKENDMMIKFTSGSTWQVVGSDNYNSLVGSPPAGVVMSEYALADPLAWAYLRPILRENNGWAMFISTPRGQNHLADMFKAAQNNDAWFCQKLAATDTKLFTPAELEAELGAYQDEYGDHNGKALFRQEYECSFDAAMLGAIYAEWIEKAEVEGRMVPNLYDPTLPVHIAWDIGYDDATALWFYQQLGTQIRLIDYFEDSLQPPEFYAGIIKSKGYNYLDGWNFGPHDAANKIFQAGGRSLVEQLYPMGIRMRVVAATSIMNGIAAARVALKRTFFDPVKCAKGIKHLRQYQWKFDAQRKIFSSTPLHDEHSHGADAFEIIGQVAADDIASAKKPEGPRFLHEVTANEVFWPSINSGSTHTERI